MNVLSVTSECVPLIKTGGLADVAGALPKALAPLGIDMRTLLPAYQAIAQTEGEVVMRFDDLMGGAAELRQCQVAEHTVYLLVAPHLYQRGGGPYVDEFGHDYHDNAERFAALCQVAAYIARDGINGSWTPDVMHCHDWQAGLTPLYCKLHDCTQPSILTIHNMAFQGVFDPSVMEPLGLPAWVYSADHIEYYGKISTLKAAMVFADKITTVSPTYAQELADPHFGMGLEGVIQKRAADVLGILNGIDTDTWDPETEAYPYGRTTLKRKATAKAALAKEFELDGTGPIAIVVSRLSQQKGLDLLLDALPDYLDQGGELALLGSGDPALEHTFRELRNRYPGKVGVEIGYNEGLSHRMFAGGDMVLIPSRFEPCGLTQLYGLRYGTLPVVSRTGGLADTVIHANHAALNANVATGFVCNANSASALSGVLNHALALYQTPKRWQALQRNAMKQSVDWSVSASAYAALYQSLIE
ncbi:MAG: glycogen synthase GlgA [Gammaproteobacteria bacterium]|nr:glycogen synthase GlgA [Gammaproteobacteria bacterium]